MWGLAEQKVFLLIKLENIILFLVKRDCYISKQEVIFMFEVKKIKKNMFLLCDPLRTSPDCSG